MFVSQHSRKPPVICCWSSLTDKLNSSLNFFSISDKYTKKRILFQIIRLIEKHFTPVYEIRELKLGCGRAYSIAQ
jgi:hypothetical protein